MCYWCIQFYMIIKWIISIRRSVSLIGFYVTFFLLLLLHIAYHRHFVHHFAYQLWIIKKKRCIKLNKLLNYIQLKRQIRRKSSQHFLQMISNFFSHLLYHCASNSQSIQTGYAMLNRLLNINLLIGLHFRYLLKNYCILSWECISSNCTLIVGT